MIRWQYALTLVLVSAVCCAFAYVAARAFMEQPIDTITPAPERSPRVHCVQTIRCNEVVDDLAQ